MKKKALIFGGIFGALSVMLGAFGAHYMANFLTDTGRQGTYETAVRYQFYHSLFLIMLGILDDKIDMKYPIYATTAGVLLFSGSLYLIIFTGISWFGAITPVGGVLLILSWFLLAFKARKMII